MMDTILLRDGGRGGISASAFDGSLHNDWAGTVGSLDEESGLRSNQCSFNAINGGLVLAEMTSRMRTVRSKTASIILVDDNIFPRGRIGDGRVEHGEDR